MVAAGIESSPRKAKPIARAVHSRVAAVGEEETAMMNPIEAGACGGDRMRAVDSI
jgi:hypothetical protein